MAVARGLVVQTIKDVTVVNFLDSSIMDSLQIDQLSRQLYDLVDNRHRRKLILDFGKVRLLSSQTLGMLLNLHKKTQRIKGKMVICGMRKELRKVFLITKLDKIFVFNDDEETALNSFGVYTRA